MDWNINDITLLASLDAATKVLKWKQEAEKRIFGRGGKKQTKLTVKSFSRTDIENNKRKFQSQLKEALKKHPEFNTQLWVDYFTAIADLETGGTFNENAKNENSGALGYFQILKGGRKTGNQFEDMFALTRQNQKALIGGLGELGITNLMNHYSVPEIMAMAHFQGASGAINVFNGGKGIVDANGTTPTKYLMTFRNKLRGNRAIASMENKESNIVALPVVATLNENPVIYTPLENNSIAPITALEIALEYNGDIQLEPLKTFESSEQIPEVFVQAPLKRNILEGAMKHALGLQTDIPQIQQVEFNPIQYIQLANNDVIKLKQLEIQNILLNNTQSNISNSAFKYALAEHPMDEIKRKALEVEMMLVLNLAALGGPLFNSRTPIESFQGKKSPLPIVRYDNGGELLPNTWGEEDYEEDKPTHNTDDLRVKNEMMQYVQSPLFKQRAESTFMKAQQNPEYHYNTLESTLMLERNPDFANTAGYYNNENKIVISQNTTSPYNTRASTANHELSHGRHDNYSFYKPDMREALQQMDTDELNVKNIYGKWEEGLKEHDDLIYERAAIVNEVRQLMKDSGIWDYTSGNPFTEEHFKQLHEKFPHNRFTNYFSNPEKLKTAIWLQNNLAYNPQRQQDVMNYAALGGFIDSLVNKKAYGGNLFATGGEDEDVTPRVLNNEDGDIIQVPSYVKLKEDLYVMSLNLLNLLDKLIHTINDPSDPRYGEYDIRWDSRDRTYGTQQLPETIVSAPLTWEAHNVLGGLQGQGYVNRALNRFAQQAMPVMMTLVGGAPFGMEGLLGGIAGHVGSEIGTNIGNIMDNARADGEHYMSNIGGLFGGFAGGAVGISAGRTPKVSFNIARTIQKQPTNILLDNMEEGLLQPFTHNMNTIKELLNMAKAYKQSPEYRALIDRTTKEAIDLGYLKDGESLSLDSPNPKSPNIILEERPEGHLGGYRRYNNTIYLDPLLITWDYRFTPYHEGLHYERVGEPGLSIEGLQLRDKWVNLADKEEEFINKGADYDVINQIRHAKMNAFNKVFPLLNKKEATESYYKYKVKLALDEDVPLYVSEYMGIPGELVLQAHETGKILGLKTAQKYPGDKLAAEMLDKAIEANSWLLHLKASKNKTPENLGIAWELLTGNYLPAMLPVAITTGIGLSAASNQQSLGGNINRYNLGGNLFYNGGSNPLTLNLPGIVITRPYPSEQLIKLTIEKEWPSAAGLTKYRITKDPTFTRERTGAGSIEYFNEPSITYRNGATIQNPNLEPTLLFDPNTNTVEDIKLDLLHHYREYDKEYKRLLLDYTNALVGNKHTASELFWNSELGEQYRDKYGKDIEKHWDEWDLMVEENLHNDQYLTQAIDGSLRSLMASDALREKSNYDTKEGAEASWLSDKYARRAYNNILKYLRTPKK